MITARVIDSLLSSVGFKSDSVRIVRGRWIDLAYIRPAAGMAIAGLRRRLPQLEENLGVSGIRMTYGKTQIILEMPKEFAEITAEELGYDGHDLCLGVDRNFEPLTIDVRYGGLLVVGDPGTGKTELLNHSREAMKSQFRIVTPDEDEIMSIASKIGSDGNYCSNTLLIVDDCDRMTEDAWNALIHIALKGHIYNIYTIAASSFPSRVNAMTLFAFRNVVSFRISSESTLKKMALPLDATLLDSHGDGLLISTTADITRFHTISKL